MSYMLELIKKKEKICSIYFRINSLIEINNEVKRIIQLNNELRNSSNEAFISVLSLFPEYAGLCTGSAKLAESWGTMFSKEDPDLKKYGLMAVVPDDILALQITSDIEKAIILEIDFDKKSMIVTNPKKIKESDFPEDIYVRTIEYDINNIPFIDIEDFSESIKSIKIGSGLKYAYFRTPYDSDYVYSFQINQKQDKDNDINIHDDKVRISTGWSDINEPIDIDMYAIELDKEGKYKNKVCYFHKKEPGIEMEDDDIILNPDDDCGDKFWLTLSDIPSNIYGIDFIITISDNMKKNRTFNAVEDMYIRILNQKGKQLALIEHDNCKAGCISIISVQIRRTENGWTFSKWGYGFSDSDIKDLIEKYYNI